MTVWQIITAEPWTPGSILGGILLVAVISGVVWWRVREARRRD